MKSITNLFIGLVAIFAISTANAQLGKPQTVLTTYNGTGLVVSNAVAQTNVFDCTAGKELGLQLDIAATGASTSNVVVLAYASIDGSTFLLSPNSITVALTGTTPVTLVTNWTINSIQKMKFVWTNTALPGVPLTNSFLKAVVK